MKGTPYNRFYGGIRSRLSTIRPKIFTSSAARLGNVHARRVNFVRYSGAGLSHETFAGIRDETSHQTRHFNQYYATK